MQQDFAAAWEVLGEAVQTVLRAQGVPDGYERLKEFTRGRAIDAATLAAFIDALPLPQAEKARLKTLTPASYVGLAATLARNV
jgi:adenylosuccinate lyase